jgi:hypothetical protein
MPGRLRVGRVPVEGVADDADEYGHQAGQNYNAQRGIADVKPERPRFVELKFVHAAASTHILRRNSSSGAQLI